MDAYALAANALAAFESNQVAAEDLDALLVHVKDPSSFNQDAQLDTLSLTKQRDTLKQEVNTLQTQLKQVESLVDELQIMMEHLAAPDPWLKEKKQKS
ncbi:hypothetical protein BCR33DRAFT_717685 [Rhizoclosmatium globosum]|uniref:Uncharacterized protein n=1 Tax=Rhizoclosmatium globosum TaxID=329046 RepID=A0A1Y2C8X4_9FUNG|nr:hypothetical protein BCR33DRAFT_717685 [Rhizoclosmatium globosum]|eukprot:ORY43479.1 hypothetical protein BCR33DRAFT_717685 [Rhizoclosmatium globosum]